jgi:outer membrane protein OmpA-like peptidoglycan-associated protein
VKAYEQPTIGCSAVPSTITSDGTGGTVNITASAVSPQNRPLTYSYGTTAGQITGSGTSATLTLAGVAPSTVTVTCNVVDDLGQTKSAIAMVDVVSPVLPHPVPVQVTQLCLQTPAPVSFARSKARVNNQAKACLDDVALNMQRQSDAQLYITANSGDGESSQLAAQRALNIRQYLTQEKGVATGRIQVRTGTSGMTATETLVPAGATFDGAGSSPIDEASIKRHGQAYGPGDSTTVYKDKPKHHRVKHTSDSKPDANPK